MRLNLEEKLGALQKIQLNIMKMVVGNAAGPVLVMSYRRHLFGKYFVKILHNVLYKTTRWRHSEMELFATFVSRKNKCAY